MNQSIITATGSYIPPVVIPNRHFLENEFFDAVGNRIEKTNSEIIDKLYDITGIEERRYATGDQTTSDIAYLAAEEALKGTEREDLDCIIVAQNLGESTEHSRYSDMVPTIAARVKHKLRIKNPYTVAFDVPFGCPGWLQGMIMADYYIKSGDASRVLVIGAEILSRFSDPCDVDGMIYADGAGATLVEKGDTDAGILSHVSRSDTYDHAYLLWLGRSFAPNRNGNQLYIKMDGHDIYKYALKIVPEVVKKALEKAGLDIADIKKVFVHQANAKMDEAILKRLFSLYGVSQIPDNVMPMMIAWTGNSSVATLPTLLDLVMRQKLDGHRLASGDPVVFASVGAGMNVNAMVYRMP